MRIDGSSHDNPAAKEGAVQRHRLEFASFTADLRAVFLILR
jgi:hypothetical protein